MLERCYADVVGLLDSDHMLPIMACHVPAISVRARAKSGRHTATSAIAASSLLFMEMLLRRVAMLTLQEVLQGSKPRECGVSSNYSSCDYCVSLTISITSSARLHTLYCAALTALPRITEITGCPVVGGHKVTCWSSWCAVIVLPTQVIYLRILHEVMQYGEGWFHPECKFTLPRHTSPR